jgi:bacillithiol biosynthesis cysteine-adding enzyme BshC
MPTDCISYQESSYFSKLITDYLEQKPELDLLYNHFPTLNNFKLQIAEKQNSFPQVNRTTLVNAITKQYQDCKTTEVTNVNIQKLAHSNTFTITTGHQLNLFTGPLYFVYKITSTINLCLQLKKEYPQYDFVPVYWMATEDHDFEEINFFQHKNTKIKWDVECKGPVGRLKTNSLDLVFEAFANILGNSIHATYLKELFQKSYLQHHTLAAATRFLVNELFGNQGLVILDGDDNTLKRLFIPYVKKELINQTSYKTVSTTNEKLKASYPIQVNPREINLFFIEDTLRERIVLKDNKYTINNTSLSYTSEEFLDLLETNPEKFSPNVILRPLYQEVILPNLAYIGGGGELAYWLQLKSNFEANTIPFPILVLRNSALISSNKQTQKATKLELSWADLFCNQQELFNRKTREFSKFTIDFSLQKEALYHQFKALKEIAQQTDPSFLGAVEAQEKKQIKGLDTLEKRLLKAEKRVHKDQLERIINLQNELFPAQSLQERKANFSQFYLEYGPELFKQLSANLNPLEADFKIITL